MRDDWPVEMKQQQIRVLVPVDRDFAKPASDKPTKNSQSSAARNSLVVGWRWTALAFWKHIGDRSLVRRVERHTRRSTWIKPSNILISECRAIIMVNLRSLKVVQLFSLLLRAFNQVQNSKKVLCWPLKLPTPSDPSKANSWALQLSRSFQCPFKTLCWPLKFSRRVQDPHH